MNMKKAILTLVAVLGIFIVALFAAEKYTGRPSFCGLKCHIMNHNYETWKNGKHSKENIVCIDCHYAPGEKRTLRAQFRSLGQLFTYLATKEEEVRLRAKATDPSCIISECHPKENSSQKDKENFFTKKIDYRKAYQLDHEGVLLPFTHKTHEEKTIEGQKLHCTSCHKQNDYNKHFDVPIEVCFLCHFLNSKENEGRAKCSVCHEIPTKAFAEKETSGDDTPKKPITHQTLEKAKVRCSSCHLEVVRVREEIKRGSCFDCHHNTALEYIEKMEGKDGKKLMHDAHITKQTARCVNCHQNIEHKKANYLDVTIQNCAICHPEPHLYQKLLIAGEGGKGIDKAYPVKHHDMKTNCLGCHTKDGHDEKGRKIKQGEEKTCIACHDKEAGEQGEKWKKDVADSLNDARDIEKRAIDAIEKAKGKVPNANLKKAMGMLKNGQENLKIVDAGGGVHNKKYSMLLIDTAIDNLEAAIAELKPKK